MENCLIKGPASFVIDGKIIICVCGRHDIGKTQTNNEVWDKLDCPKKKLEINDTIPHTRIDMGYQGTQNVPVHRYLYESECCSVSPF